MVIKPSDGTHAQVQVKTGKTALNIDLYRNCAFPVILFQSSDLYHGEPAAHVTCLSRAEVESFLTASGGLAARSVSPEDGNVSGCDKAIKGTIRVLALPDNAAAAAGSLVARRQ